MEIIDSCEKITQERKVRTGCCVLKKAAQKWMLLVGMMAQSSYKDDPTRMSHKAQETCGSWGWEEDAYPEPFALPSGSVRGRAASLPRWRDSCPKTHCRAVKPIRAGGPWITLPDKCQQSGA